MKRFLLIGFLFLIVLIERRVVAQQWVPLKHKPTLPTDFVGISTMLLLPDGAVMAQLCTSSVDCGNQWVKLTPDEKGSYVNGTWSSMASMMYERTAFSSAVLSDGRVFVVGGEYTNDKTGAQGEIYDPTADKWTSVAAIPTTLFDPSTGNILDAQSILLDGDKVLIAPVGATGTNSTIIYNAASNTWSAGASFVTGRNQDEASWVKLPDNSILSPDNDNLHSERYLPATNEWVDDAPIPSASQLFKSYEMGAALLLPNGKAFLLGGTGHTLLYTPSGNRNPGTWAAGPDLPDSQVACDAPAAMMSDGTIVVATGPGCADGGSQQPTSFYRYDYATPSSSNGSFTLVTNPGSPNSKAEAEQVEASASNFRFLDLPDGNVLSAQGSDNTGQLYICKPAGSPLVAGKPNISNVTENADWSYHLKGTGLTGISQGAVYGDDAQMDTNYPIVRLTDSSGNVHFARSFNWSSAAVMSGSTLESVEFALPNDLLEPPGNRNLSLAVIANGIGSNTVPFVTPFFFDTASWAGASGSDGPIFTGDLNGDGKTDVFMWDNVTHSWAVNLSTGKGFKQEVWTGAWGSDGPIFTGDLNGDHKTDVFMWRAASDTWTVNLSTGAGFTAEEWTGAPGSVGFIFTGDLNGDHKTDVFMWNSADRTWDVNLSTGKGFTQQKWEGTPGSVGPIFTGDLNGDGKTDVFMWDNVTHSWAVNLSTGKGFKQEVWTGAWGSDGPIFTGDLNGDGKTDVFMWRGSTHSWTINLSTGKGFTQQEWTGAFGSDGPIFTGDLNGDKKTDVFMWRNASNSWTVNLSTGKGFTQEEWKGMWGSDGPIFTGDLNGDHKTDVFMWREANKSWSINLVP